MVEPEQWRPEVEEVEEPWLDKYGGDFPGFYPLPESPIATEEDDTMIDTVNEPGDRTAFYPYSSAHEGKAKVVVRENDNVGEVVEEEVVELEFEKVKPKLKTHSMHCPNCKFEIKKVILRRKLLSYRPHSEESFLVELEPLHEPLNLVGYLSCLSLFTCSDNGYFNPFDIFRRRKTTSDPAILSSEEGKAKVVVRENGASQGENEDTMVHIANEPEQVVVAQSRGRSWLGYDGLLAEILKSIVYGGLMEVIASLSVVVSAAASDATTLFIISVALASLMGGVFVIGHNLWNLRDDCYKDSSNNKAVNKYKKLLGQVNYFPLHAFFTILSFLVFGMVPPVAYGYSFHETNDKDFTVMAVATASLICVALLAIFKAYTNKCTVFEYFKTMVYYVTIAVSMSGVSYVAGNLVTRLMEEYGLFGPSSGGGMSFFPDATTSLASF